MATFRWVAQKAASAAQVLKFRSIAELRGFYGMSSFPLSWKGLGHQMDWAMVDMSGWV